MHVRRPYTPHGNIVDVWGDEQPSRTRPEAKEPPRSGCWRLRSVGFGSLFGKNRPHGWPSSGPPLHRGRDSQVLNGDINPGRVFDRTIPLADVPAGYAAMDARDALKVLVTPCDPRRDRGARYGIVDGVQMGPGFMATKASEVCGP